MSRPSSKTRQRHFHPNAITWSEKIDKGIRGSVQDVAAILNVPVSFVYNNAETIPGLVRVGKYLRWDLRAVAEWRSNGERGL